jgi:hypothetical protein
MSLGLAIWGPWHGVAKATPGPVQLNLPKLNFCASAKCMDSPCMSPAWEILGGLGLGNVLGFSDLGALAWGGQGHPRPNPVKPTQAKFLCEYEMYEQSMNFTSLGNFLGDWV